MSCHAIGYLGGKIGPDLTRIGQIRSERDLLEAIVFPNASFARSYEPVVVSTTSGAMHSGVLRSDRAGRNGAGDGAGAGNADPAAGHRRHEAGHGLGHAAGLAEQLTRQELADLLAFLKATRSGAQ